MVIVITLGIILVVAIIIAVSLNSTLPANDWKTFTKNRLKEIDTETNFDDYVSMKSVLIDLDTLLDHALKNSGLSGQTMGERLKSAHGLFEKEQYNDIWTAHKMRNQLVHEPTFKPSIAKLQASRNILKNAILKLV